METTTRALIALMTTCLGCAATPASSGNTAPADGGSSDPRPATERACPMGAQLTLQLWDVYAMPRTPSGDAWDGVSAGTRDLVCGAAAAFLTERLRDALNGQFPGSGVAFDAFVRDRVQSTLATQCGLGLGWLQERYEGPDMFARGAEGGAMRWQTPAVQDQWRAPLRTTTTGAPATWTMPCGDVGTQSSMTVIDDDLALDDTMGTARFSLAQLTPQMICAGWVLFAPFEGVAATVMRVQVDGAGQNCDGLRPTLLEEVTMPDAPPPVPSPRATDRPATDARPARSGGAG